MVQCRTGVVSLGFVATDGTLSPMSSTPRNRNPGDHFHRAKLQHSDGRSAGISSLGSDRDIGLNWSKFEGLVEGHGSGHACLFLDKTGISRAGATAHCVGLAKASLGLHMSPGEAALQKSKRRGSTPFSECRGSMKDGHEDPQLGHKEIGQHQRQHMKHMEPKKPQGGQEGKWLGSCRLPGQLDFNSHEVCKDDGSLQERHRFWPSSASGGQDLSSDVESGGKDKDTLMWGGPGEKVARNARSFHPEVRRAAIVKVTCAEKRLVQVPHASWVGEIGRSEPRSQPMMC